MINVSDIANKFNLRIIGDSKQKVLSVGSSLKQGDNFLYWAKSEAFIPKIKKGVILCSEDINIKNIVNKNLTFLVCQENSRLVFSKIIFDFFVPDFFSDTKNYVDFHLKNNKISVANNVHIGKNVKIGNGTIIEENAIIKQNIIIGNNCLIKNNTSVGTNGLSHDYDKKKGLYFKFPQIGNIIIENNVEIGPHSTVRRGAIDSTIIGSGSYIGSMCNIGHNTIIGKNCTFISHNITGGSSSFGNNVFVGVTASIKNGIFVGQNAKIGQGAVVVKNIPENETWVGNPAKKIK